MAAEPVEGFGSSERSGSSAGCGSSERCGSSAGSRSFAGFGSSERSGPPRPWRLSARLLVVRGPDLLVLRAHDPADPSVGQWYEVPGGGVEPGETTMAAAVRETAEETGYVVPAGWVGEPCWHGETTYRWLGRRHWSEMVVHVARVCGELDRRPTAWVPDEVASFLEVRWLPLAEVLDGRHRFFPESMPADLPRMLAGGRIEAGFTVWS